jgi:hypothetical protein
MINHVAPLVKQFSWPLQSGTLADKPDPEPHALCPSQQQYSTQKIGLKKGVTSAQYCVYWKNQWKKLLENCCGGFCKARQIVILNTGSFLVEDALSVRTVLRCNP